MGFNILAERETVTVILGGKEIRCYCRKPEPHEMAQYQRDVQKAFKRGEIMADSRKLFKVQVAYGYKVLEGVRKGDLLAGPKPLTEENPEWKKLIRKHEPRILAAIGRAMFETAVAEKDDDDDEMDVDDDPLAP